MPDKRLAAAIALVLAATGCAGAAGGGTAGPLRIGYFQGAVAGPESVVAANEELASKVPARIELRPIDSGVAGMAQLRAGAFPVVSGVGNPPFVGAFTNGTDVRVVFAESLDQSGLAVNDEIESPSDLRKIGVLVGSTLDFQLRGWLKEQGLTGKVQIASFASEAAEAAAWKAGKIDAVFISQAFLLELRRHGARVLVGSAEIAEKGYAAVNLLAVSSAYIRQNPQAVQALVCQISRAQTLVKGPQGERYIRPAARFLGVRPEDAVEATRNYPYIPAAEETSWLKGPDGRAASGRLVQNFRLTAEFLVSQGRAKTVPGTEQIAAHVDPTFWDKAQAGGCK
ncbi:taurine ABC transporter substrate-binding protein [Thermomonospora cellulosilytica]|uniref:NitT/TauT family transport system substrate-binding protein n=1 Tax=Thermomonospora cellulosilytica TaxID=1411118 RepID=A0A7W3MVF5_9ACTN|nr:ABC transporter substrate-binding protein [Thermomonospora cellulosilytica]MBA9002634.1 NitT/TauT family transport system substrate-binding protein [Thermomonospora cellulosilytica]